MGERVVFEYIANDGEGNSKMKVSDDFIPRILSFERFRGSVSHGDDVHQRFAVKVSKRARHRVRKTLDMFQEMYEELFDDDLAE